MLLAVAVACILRLRREFQWAAAVSHSLFLIRDIFAILQLGRRQLADDLTINALIGPLAPAEHFEWA